MAITMLSNLATGLLRRYAPRNDSISVSLRLRGGDLRCGSYKHERSATF
jgi:hypothetical protein